MLSYVPELDVNRAFDVQGDEKIGKWGKEQWYVHHRLTSILDNLSRVILSEADQREQKKIDSDLSVVDFEDYVLDRDTMDQKHRLLLTNLSELGGLILPQSAAIRSVLSDTYALQILWSYPYFFCGYSDEKIDDRNQIFIDFVKAIVSMKPSLVQLPEYGVALLGSLMIYPVYSRYNRKLYETLMPFMHLSPSFPVEAYRLNPKHSVRNFNDLASIGMTFGLWQVQQNFQAFIGDDENWGVQENTTLERAMRVWRYRKVSLETIFTNIPINMILNIAGNELFHIGFDVIIQTLLEDRLDFTFSTSNWSLIRRITKQQYAPEWKGPAQENLNQLLIPEYIPQEPEEGRLSWREMLETRDLQTYAPSVWSLYWETIYEQHMLRLFRNLPGMTQEWLERELQNETNPQITNQIRLALVELETERAQAPPAAVTAAAQARSGGNIKTLKTNF
jgi:hypothetical protein